MSLDGDAWISVQYQNANNSVRVSHKFMEAVLEDGEWQTKFVTDGSVAKTYEARKLMPELEQGVGEGDETLAGHCRDGQSHDPEILGHPLELGGRHFPVLDGIALGSDQQPRSGLERRRVGGELVAHGRHALPGRNRFWF